MNKETQESKSPPALPDLYPELSEEELKEAEETLDLYLEHALRMYERMKQDPAAYAALKALTAAKGSSTMEPKRSNPS